MRSGTTRGWLGLTLGLAVMAVELWLATPAQPMAPAPELIDRAGFFATVTGWRKV